MSRQKQREERLADLIEACRENTTAAILFHDAIDARAGLCPTDHRALDVLLRHESVTAGELAARTGRASASVTSLIDRLEARGLVRRTSDPADRRRVIVQPVPERVNELNELFLSLKREMARLLQRYDESQLEAIEDFLRSSAAVLREAATRLGAGTPPQPP